MRHFIVLRISLMPIVFFRQINNLSFKISVQPVCRRIQVCFLARKCPPFAMGWTAQLRWYSMDALCAKTMCSWRDELSARWPLGKSRKLTHSLEGTQRVNWSWRGIPPKWPMAKGRKEWMSNKVRGIFRGIIHWYNSRPETFYFTIFIIHVKHFNNSLFSSQFLGFQMGTGKSEIGKSDCIGNIYMAINPVLINFQK